MPRPAVGVETTLRRRMGSSSVRDRLTTLSRGYWRFVRKHIAPHLERRFDKGPQHPHRSAARVLDALVVEESCRRVASTA